MTGYNKLRKVKDVTDKVHFEEIEKKEEKKKKKDEMLPNESEDASNGNDLPSSTIRNLELRPSFAAQTTFKFQCSSHLFQIFFFLSISLSLYFLSVFL